ncbi:hypothetical protein M758_10G006800 [Ceratodon purpureus]|nr:hypothetical protein KC19_10G007500 [Ceratodon purpureus]KAG0602324.1 hypothetical protein M758_10G006800 [Ceratodon purpureus]
MGYYMGDMGATKASTRLVNETEKVIHLYVESAGENYFFKRTLKAREAFVEEFDANSTYRKMRVFVLEPGGSNRLTDLSISSDDMLDSQQIAVAQLADGRLVLLFTPRSGETLSRAMNNGKVTWTQSFMNKFYWLKGPSYPMPDK